MMVAVAGLGLHKPFGYAWAPENDAPWARSPRELHRNDGLHHRDSLLGVRRDELRRKRAHLWARGRYLSRVSVRRRAVSRTLVRSFWSPTNLAPESDRHLALLAGVRPRARATAPRAPLGGLCDARQVHDYDSASGDLSGEGARRAHRGEHLGRERLRRRRLGAGGTQP